MKRRIALVAAAIVAQSCATASKLPAIPPLPAPPPPREVAASDLADREGDSTDTAVAVPAMAAEGGVPFENEWMFRRFGRFRRLGGGTGVLDGRRYSVVNIELANGDKKTVYFDITENWNTWRPPK